MLGGFLVLWLAFALLVNKAPNYTRLLITLPFVAYLVVEALRWATNRWRSVRFAPQLIVGVFVVAVVALNVSAAWDYVQLGRKEGEPIGSTGRFVPRTATSGEEVLHRVQRDHALLRVGQPRHCARPGHRSSPAGNHSSSRSTRPR